MKKYLALLLIGILGLIPACSRSNPEAEEKALMHETIRIFDSASEKLDKANTGKEAADAIVVFAKEMKAVRKKTEELDKKYPEIKKLSNDKFKEETDGIIQSGKRFMNSYMQVLIKFQGDKEIEGVKDRIEEVMR